MAEIRGRNPNQGIVSACKVEKEEKKKKITRNSWKGETNSAA